MLDEVRVTMSRAEVEDYLYADAALLDQWRLEEWLQRMAPSIKYLVPATDGHDAGSPLSLAIAADDRRALEGRVARLLSQRAHCEHPFSRTRRLITNVRIARQMAAAIDIEANFAIHRFRPSGGAQYVGRYEIGLTRDPAGALLMVRRAAILDHHDLTDQGVVSIIL